MPPLVQICVVIVTLAFVAIVVTTVFTMIRHSETAARLSAAAQVSLAGVDRVVQDAQELLASVREIMPPVQRVVKRFERLGGRAADLSTAVLDEIEEPVLTAVAVARGVKTGAGHLLDLLTRRFAQPRSSNNGDQDHE
jgi:uncharacterized protein YoxC